VQKTYSPSFRIGRMVFSNVVMLVSPAIVVPNKKPPMVKSGA